MKDAWELVKDDEREHDQLTTFIIFCEDTVSEPTYFRHFECPGKLKINIVDDQLSSYKNILNTLKYCQETGLLDESDGGYKLKQDSSVQVWSVFDRDVENEERDVIALRNNIDFTFSIQAAEDAGLNVAWSNDVFELWILLHFEDVEPGQWIHRNTIYDRLTRIFREMQNQPEEMKLITSNENFHYKKILKRKVFFVRWVLPAITGLTVDAVGRAKSLDKGFPANSKCHEMNPSSQVYRLIENILKFR